MRYVKKHKVYNSAGRDTKFTHDGDYIIICDRSGFPAPASQTKKEWNGLRVRVDFWDRRQPQDFIPTPRDIQTAQDPRPDIPVDTGSIAIDNLSLQFTFSDQFVMTYNN